MYYNLGAPGTAKVTSFKDDNVVRLNGGLEAVLAKGQSHTMFATASGDVVETTEEAQVFTTDQPVASWVPSRYAATRFVIPTPRGTEHALTVMPTCEPEGSVSLPDPPFRVDADGTGSAVLGGELGSLAVTEVGGGPSAVAGPEGANFPDAFAFAAGQRFELGSSGLSLDTQYTVDVWVKTPLAATATEFRVLTHGDSNGAHVAAQRQSSGASYMLGVLDEATTGFHSSTVDLQALSAGWHRLTVVGTVDSQSSPITIFYVDGGATAQSDAPFRVTDPVFAVGGFASATTEAWGEMARLRVYPSVALNLQQVQALAEPLQGHARVDNADAAAVTVTGAWTNDTALSGFFGADYLTDGGSGSGSVRFEATLPSRGSYEVFVRYPSDSAAAPAVPHTIEHADGSDTVNVDQSVGGGRWAKIARYSFNAGQVAALTIAAVGTFTTNADAAMFVRVSDPACASVQLKKGTNVEATALLYPGVAFAFDAAVTSTFNSPATAAILESTGPVVVSARSLGDGACGSGGAEHDPRVVVPAHEEVVGIASTTVYVHALETGTSIEVYTAHGQIAATSLTPGSSYSLNGFPATFPSTPGLGEYMGTAMRIVASKPIGAVAIDEEGGCGSTPFLPVYLMSR